MVQEPAGDDTPAQDNTLYIETTVEAREKEKEIKKERKKLTKYVVRVPRNTGQIAAQKKVRT